MRAVECAENGAPQVLRLVDRAVPTPGKGEVRIAMEAASVNFPDVLMVAGKYQMQPPLPFVPGIELAGTVSALGDGVTQLQVGQRVVGGIPFGAFAEHVCAPAMVLAPVPDGVSSADAAAMFVTYGTSLYALQDRASLASGETLVVLGASGGVGLAAVQLGKAMGARVIACASSADKLAFCAEHGADEGIDYGTEDLKKRIRQLTGGQGADVVYDAVGGPAAEAALRATAWEGRYLVVGFAAGEIPKIPLNLVLLRSCQVVGVFWGSFVARNPERHQQLVEQLFQWVQQGRIRPHVHGTYPLEEAATALQLLVDRQVRGKVLLEA
ncbi:MAG: NADPH:quinone oxidoreductase family protein [Myxococcales bacterium]|nr:NADPH:quinone oxidoreductase family protein [Myxococcales bacterium]